MVYGSFLAAPTDVQYLLWLFLQISCIFHFTTYLICSLSCSQLQFFPLHQFFYSPVHLYFLISTCFLLLQLLLVCPRVALNQTSHPACGLSASFGAILGILFQTEFHNAIHIATKVPLHWSFLSLSASLFPSSLCKIGKHTMKILSVFHFACLPTFSSCLAFVTLVFSTNSRQRGYCSASIFQWHLICVYILCGELLVLCLSQSQPQRRSRFSCNIITQGALADWFSFHLLSLISSLQPSITVNKDWVSFLQLDCAQLYQIYTSWSKAISSIIYYNLIVLYIYQSAPPQARSLFLHRSSHPWQDFFTCILITWTGFSALFTL